MKRIIIFIIILIVVVGCENDLMNNPTKRVENLMNNYITLNSSVLNDLDETLLSETIMTPSQKERYRSVIKRQYQHLSYNIKEETIDGDIAVVEVEIEVYDYNKVINDVNNYLKENSNEFITSDGLTDMEKFNNYKLDNLEKTKEKITYTLNLTLRKIDDKWKLDDLTDIEINKIHGLYNG